MENSASSIDWKRDFCNVKTFRNYWVNHFGPYSTLSVVSLGPSGSRLLPSSWPWVQTWQIKVSVLLLKLLMFWCCMLLFYTNYGYLLVILWNLMSTRKIKFCCLDICHLGNHDWHWRKEGRWLDSHNSHSLFSVFKCATKWDLLSEYLILSEERGHNCHLLQDSIWRIEQKIWRSFL